MATRRRTEPPTGGPANQNANNGGDQKISNDVAQQSAQAADQQAGDQQVAAGNPAAADQPAEETPAERTPEPNIILTSDPKRLQKFGPPRTQMIFGNDQKPVIFPDVPKQQAGWYEPRAAEIIEVCPLYKKPVEKGGN